MRVCSAAQPCPTLCDPMDYSRPRSSVYGIPQARILEWVTISFLRGSSPQGIFPTQGSYPYLLHWQAGSLPVAPPGKPTNKSQERTRIPNLGSALPYGLPLQRQNPTLRRYGHRNKYECNVCANVSAVCVSTNILLFCSPLM